MRSNHVKQTEAKELVSLLTCIEPVITTALLAGLAYLSSGKLAVDRLSKATGISRPRVQRALDRMRLVAESGSLDPIADDVPTRKPTRKVRKARTETVQEIDGVLIVS